MKHNILISIFMSVAAAFTFQASAKKEKEPPAEIEAKIWFSDGRIYNGKMPKHWRTRRQTYLNPGHNFHIMPADGSDKTIKCEATEVDSILITASSHPDFAPGDFYIPAEGISFRKKTKLIRRAASGPYADFYKIPYWDNCTVGQMQLDQLMELWMIRFKDTGQHYLFFVNQLEKGCNKSKFRLDGLIDGVKKENPALADALINRFSHSDKKQRKEIAKQIGEHPEILLEFINDFMSQHQTR